MKIMSINAGSSSLKFSLFNMDNEEVIASGLFERIGIEQSCYTIKYNGEKLKQEVDLPDHSVAVSILLEKLVELMSQNPAKRFGLDIEINQGKTANLCVFDLETEYKINSQEFYSKGKSTPFDGMSVYGKCLMNFTDGKLVYQKK